MNEVILSETPKERRRKEEKVRWRTWQLRERMRQKEIEAKKESE